MTRPRSLARTLSRAMLAVTLVVSSSALLVMAAWMYKTLEAQYQRDQRNAEEALRDWLSQHDRRIGRALARLAEEIAKVGPSAIDADFAGKLRARTDLDLLEIVRSDGTVLSSAHWRARVGVVDPQDAAHLANSAKQALLRTEVVLTDGVAGGALSLQGVAPLPGSPGVFLVGGSLIGHDTVLEWSRITRSGITVSGKNLKPISIVPVQRNATYRFSAPELGGREPVTIHLGIPRDWWAAILVNAGVTLAIVMVVMWLVSLLASRFLARRLTRPLARLAEGARAMGGRKFEPIPEQHTEDEVDLLIQSFNQMARDREAAELQLLQSERMAAWRDAARKVAHEIKNPLFPLQLAIETLQRAYRLGRENFPELLDENARLIVEQVERINRLVGEFSSFARMPEPVLRDTDLAGTLRRAIALYEADHTLTVRLTAPEEPLMVPHDPDQLAQVVVNLLKNALEAGAWVVDVQLARDASSVSISLTDNGPGLPAAILERPFVPTVSTKPGGSGLGLAIVQGIVTQHGGRVMLENLPERGARFTVCLESRPTTC